MLRSLHSQNCFFFSCLGAILALVFGGLACIASRVFVALRFSAIVLEKQSNKRHVASDLVQAGRLQGNINVLVCNTYTDKH